MPRFQHVSQRLTVMVLQGYGTDVAQIQAQPGQLIIRRRHFAVANEDDVLQRQKASQSGMIAEGRELGRVGRAVASAARQHVKPHWQASIASSQGKQLQLLQPLPRRVVPRLQARRSFNGRLLRKQTRKSHGHGVRMETMQVELIVLGRLGDQIAPDDRPLVV